MYSNNNNYYQQQQQQQQQYQSTQQLNQSSNPARLVKSNSQVLDDSSSGVITSGIANIPNQVHYHHSKRKININVMLFGESGLGKTGVINQVLGQPIFQDYQRQEEGVKREGEGEEKDATAVNIRIRRQELEESGSRALLSVVDFPSFGGRHSKKEAGLTALAYLQDQFELTLREESKLHRLSKDSQDPRVNTVLYFHNPNSHKLSELDIKLIESMCKLANVLIVIAKGDTLLRHEYLRIKTNMREQLNNAGISPFRHSEDASTVFEPFICVSGCDLLTNAPARNYIWGSLKVAPASSPASLNINGLTNLLFKDFLPDLILATQDKYEAWKGDIIRQVEVKEEEWSEPANVLTKIISRLSDLRMTA